MQEPLITIPVQLTYEDLREYIRFSFIPIKHYSLTTNFSAIFFALLSIFIYVFVNIYYESICAAISLLFFILPLLLIITYYLIPYLLYKNNKLYYESNIQYRFFPQSIQIYENGTAGSSVQNFHPIAFAKIVETKKAFYFILFSHSGHIIPKNQMDAGQIAYLHNLLQQSYADKFKPLL